MNSRQAINLLKGLEQSLDDYCELNDEGKAAFRMAIEALELFGNAEPLPSEQPETHDKRTEKHACDCISRAAAIDALDKRFDSIPMNQTTEILLLRKDLRDLPSAQPERTCVNCGRTANNGGWYADGRTRCPIEEHYALPKDGYCHLWEKRNVTDDDYPERREE